MKYRIDLLHYTEGSGYTHTETINNVDTSDFDLLAYLKEYFLSVIVNDKEWYDAQLINNDNDKIIKEVFDVVASIG